MNNRSMYLRRPHDQYTDVGVKVEYCRSYSCRENLLASDDLNKEQRNYLSILSDLHCKALLCFYCIMLKKQNSSVFNGGQMKSNWGSSAATVYSSNAGQMQEKRRQRGGFWFYNGDQCARSCGASSTAGEVRNKRQYRMFSLLSSPTESLCADRLQDPNTRLVGSVAQSALVVVDSFYSF